MVGQQRRRGLAGRDARVERLARRGDLRGEVLAVADAGLFQLADPRQLVQRERADQLEHLEPRVVGAATDEAGLEQLVQFGARTPADRRLERGGVEAAEKCAGAQEHLLRRRREQVVAPPDRRCKRLLPVGEISQRAPPDRQRLRQLLPDLRRRKHRGSRRRELDRQRKAVERPADPRHGPRDRRTDDESAVRRKRALQEHLYGGAVGDLLLRLAGRQRKRIDLEHLLAADPQGSPAGNEHSEPGRTPEQLRGQDGRGHQVLEVVDHQQQLAVTEVVRQRVCYGSLAPVALGDGARDLGRHQRRIGHVLQADERRTVGIALLVAGGELEQQPRLPHPARAG